MTANPAGERKNFAGFRRGRYRPSPGGVLGFNFLSYLCLAPQEKKLLSKAIKASKQESSTARAVVRGELHHPGNP
jgi:hypothetical protein